MRYATITERLKDHILPVGHEMKHNINLHQLREEWPKYHRFAAPLAISPELLQRAIGYKIQKEALGGLNRRTQLRLSFLRTSSEQGNKSKGDRSAPALKFWRSMMDGLPVPERPIAA